MSPVPIIERQRALTRIGEIRIGGEKPQRGAGKKLEAFRATSQHKEPIEALAGLYGGAPLPWESPNGPAWQVYTTSAALPVLLVTGHSLNQVYELRDGQACVRRCDGITEDYSDGPCICNAEGVDKCDVITRLMVVLPETGSGLGWQLRTKGENAARELAGSMTIAENLAQGRAFIPATLRLTQRRSILDGQTVRYVVPVLDFNLVAEAQTLTGGARPELPQGYTPVPELVAAGPTLAEGLETVATQEVTRRPRGQTPIPPADDIEFGDTPVPVESDPGNATAPASPTGPVSPTGGEPGSDTPTSTFITKAQQKRLFAIAKGAGLDEPAIREFVKTYTGQESTAAITKDAYEPLVAAIQAQAAPA